MAPVVQRAGNSIHCRQLVGDRPFTDSRPTGLWGSRLVNEPNGGAFLQFFRIATYPGNKVIRSLNNWVLGLRTGKTERSDAIGISLTWILCV